MVEDRTGGRAHLRPETAAGGYSSADGTVDFYFRVQSLLPEQGHILDLGAGRGAWLDDPVSTRRRLRDLRGAGRHVVGVDLEIAVVNNSALDSAVIVGPDSRLPFPASSVDVVVADAVFEHVDADGSLAAELQRVVRPGGWVCARTPNRNGYVGLGARLVPNALHTRLLQVLQPNRRSEDVFPVRYRLNTRRDLTRAFPPTHWRNASYGHNPDPAYAGGRRWASGAIAAWQRVAPERCSTVLHVFLQRL